jgi:hypothetical protein
LLVFNPRASGGSAVPGVSRGEGTNSGRLITPGERNALAKSKVHQISRAHGVWLVISLISKYGCSQGVKEAKILKKHLRKLGKSFHITNCKTFLQFLNVNVKNLFSMRNPKVKRKFVSVSVYVLQPSRKKSQREPHLYSADHAVILGFANTLPATAELWRHITADIHVYHAFDIEVK